MISIKVGKPKDCHFVAWGICMALHREPDALIMPRIAAICRRTDVLYSYRHAMIAWDSDTPIGMCLCYDGGKYHEMRNTTFPLFKEAFMSTDTGLNKESELDNAEDETEDGEYYIDSLAVLPAYRRMGVGRSLMQAQLRRAHKLGYTKATLLVDPENIQALQLYESLGFVHERDVYAFGQLFWKWQRLLLNTKMLEERFDHYNRLIFDGRLPTLPLETSTARSFLGLLVFRRRRNLYGRTEEYGYKIRISTFWINTIEQLDNTLVHEMIHYYTHVNNMKDRSAHGPLFRQLMADINARFDLNITVSYKQRRLYSDATSSPRNHNAPDFY